MEQKNYLKQSVILAFIVPLFLVLLGFLPEIKLNETVDLRQVNIFADVIADTNRVILKNSSVAIKNSPTDTCAPNVICIEDYSKNKNTLTSFFNLLDSCKKGAKARVAFFGDSYIEGDMITADLRDTLQALFGGRGVGYVPLATPLAGFRQTIRHSFRDINTYTLVEDKHSPSPFAISGQCFIPNEGCDIQYLPVKNNPKLNKFYDVKLFYKNTLKTAICNYSTTGQSWQKSAISSNGKIDELSVKANGSNSFRLQFWGTSGMVLYGASFEDKSGVYVDNFSMRGNSGAGLLKVNTNMFKSFDSLQHYDLIILQYGLNVVSNKTFDYSWYEKKMLKVVAHLQKAFPNKGILMLGVSDRSYKNNGSYQTMPEIPALIATQREIAQKTGIAFWDMFTAMGGENTMVQWANAKPALANKDYTHLTFRGGKKVAEALTATLLYEKKKHDNQAVVQ